MRTGAEYREALRDGRRVWIMGEGLIDDVTVHPATRAMVDEYVAWYDRHFDPAWRDTVLGPADSGESRTPWAFTLPTSSDDLRGMGQCFSATTFLSAGNITHTPAYGNLIALGILDAVQQRNVSREQITHAAAYRDLIARTGRFLTSRPVPRPSAIACATILALAPRFSSSARPIPGSSSGERLACTPAPPTPRTCTWGGTRAWIATVIGRPSSLPSMLPASRSCAGRSLPATRTRSSPP